MLEDFSADRSDLSEDFVTLLDSPFSPVLSESENVDLAAWSPTFTGSDVGLAALAADVSSGFGEDEAQRLEAKTGNKASTSLFLVHPSSCRVERNNVVLLRDDSVVYVAVAEGRLLAHADLGIRDGIVKAEELWMLDNRWLVGTLRSILAA